MITNNENFSLYQLRIHLRLILAIIYFSAAGLWLLNTDLKSWVSVVQLFASVAFLIAGVGWLFFYQRRRLTQYSAWLPIFAVPLIVVLWVLEQRWHYGVLLALMPFYFLLSGAASYWRHVDKPGIPSCRGDWLLALKLAFDEVVLGYFVSASSTPSGKRVIGITDEVHLALEVMKDKGWLANPSSFHTPPQEPAVVEMEEKSALGRNYQVIRFPSQYQPHPELPGSRKWLEYESTHTVRARIFEHPEVNRPWLMCIHGYRMGWTYMDFQLFSPGWLHHKLGFNLIMPLLPLHGHRKEGFRSGDDFFEGDLLNLIHAEGQAQSDLRACIQWLRKQRNATRLGVYGISLGGLNASLLSSLESGIDSVVAGIPLVDPSQVFELNAPRRVVKAFEQKGVTPEVIRKLLAPISPLSMESQLPLEARAIIAGNHDRIVPLERILDLQQHWDNCRTHWFDGTHLSIRRERNVGIWLKDIWQSCGLLDHLENSQNQGNLALH